MDNWESIHKQITFNTIYNTYSLLQLNDNKMSVNFIIYI